MNDRGVGTTNLEGFCFNPISRGGMLRIFKTLFLGNYYVCTRRQKKSARSDQLVGVTEEEGQML